MKKPARRDPLIFSERRRRWLEASGHDRVVEYFHYPSGRALDIWEYVICLGISRIAGGKRYSLDGHGRGCLLHYVRRGELRHVLGGKKYLARAGDICLVTPGTARTHFHDQPGTTDLWWVLFDGRNIERILTELDADADPLIVNVDRRRFESLFHELWGVVSKPPLAHEARMHAILHAMLAELFAARTPMREAPRLIPSRSDLSEKVRLAVHLIEQHHDRNLGLKQIQELVGMDLYHLVRRFRKETGLPPIQYLNRYRIEMAKRLLASTARPVHDVARRVGYADADYFARVFRKIAGTSPQEYRRSGGDFTGKPEKPRISRR